MREQLVAWAGDCMVRGDVELGEGRLSDQVNDLDLVTFFNATLAAIEDGHEVTLDEVEVERRELYLIEVNGRRGDPARRLRTVQDGVMLQVGPFTVTGSIHRPTAAQPLSALAGWSRFVPVTDAVVDIAGSERPPVHQDVVLVNRERINRHELRNEILVQSSDAWSPLPSATPRSTPEATSEATPQATPQATPGV